jgi:hypothetical protein
MGCLKSEPRALVAATGDTYSAVQYQCTENCDYNGEQARLFRRVIDVVFDFEIKLIDWLIGEFTVIANNLNADIVSHRTRSIRRLQVKGDVCLSLWTNRNGLST